MKTALLSLSLLATALSSAQNSTTAQLVTPNSSKEWSVDASMWGSLDADRTLTPAFWGVANYDGFHLEVRNNFDMFDATSCYFGYKVVKTKLGSAELSFTPAAGFVRYSEKSNLGLTSHTVLESPRWRLYTVNQHLLAMSEWTSNITYNWIDAGYNVGPIVLGASAQRYAVGRYMNFDAGPSLGFEVKKGDSKFYAKAYAWDFWDEQERYYGLWFGLYLSGD